MASNQKRPAVDAETFRRLDTYRAEHGLANSSEAIAHLLDAVDDESQKSEGEQK